MSESGQSGRGGIGTWLKGFGRGFARGYGMAASRTAARLALDDAPFVKPRSDDGREMPGYLLEHRALSGIELRYYGQAMFVELTLPGDASDPVSEAWTALSAYMGGHNRENQVLQPTTPLIQAAIGGDWRFWLALSVEDRKHRAPTPLDLRLRFNVLPSPRALSLQVDKPDDPAQLASAVEQLAKRVEERREELPASMNKRPMGTPVTIWRYGLAEDANPWAKRTEVAVFVL